MNLTKILVIDPERSMRNTLKERLTYEKWDITAVESPQQALEEGALLSFGVVVCDLSCLNGELRQLLTSTEAEHPPFVILSNTKEIETAVNCMQQGAADFLVKPIDFNKLLKSLRRILGADEVPKPAKTQAMQRITSLPRLTSHSAGHVDEIIGESKVIAHVKRLIDKVAPSDARVLITGANGTGKELVARWLHEKSLRNAGPFVEVNCAAIPSELIESELFGHEKGAFTSAIKQRKGKFEQADGGTLFLDEIGDMSLSAQAKVLRALQERRITRVGSDRDITVNVRVVAATNKNLHDEIAHGAFREDLYHRLSVILIRVPSLSERIEDVNILAKSFVSRICEEAGIPKKEITEEAIHELECLEWHGNIRELRNVVERLIILSEKDITLDDVKTYAEEEAL